MKLLKTFSGAEHLLADDEAENIIKLKTEAARQNATGIMIKLRNQNYVAASAIESIGPIPLVPVRNGHVVHKGGWYTESGNRIYLEDWKEVKYLPDPRIVALTETQRDLPRLPEEKKQLS